MQNSHHEKSDFILSTLQPCSSYLLLCSAAIKDFWPEINTQKYKMLSICRRDTPHRFVSIFIILCSGLFSSLNFFDSAGYFSCKTIFVMQVTKAMMFICRIIFVEFFSLLTTSDESDENIYPNGIVWPYLGRNSTSGQDLSIATVMAVGLLNKDEIRG